MSDENGHGSYDTPGPPSWRDDDFGPPADKKGGPPPGHPLATIWTSPRRTIRRILETDPTYLVIPLSMASGVVQALDRASSRNLGDRIGTPTILATAMILGPLSGVVSLYVFGWILSWSGRRLGGVARAEDVRAALGWSQAPALPLLAILAVQLAFLGDEMFMTGTPGLNASFGLRMLLLISGFIEVVLGVWSFILMLKCLGEAHRFSAWRALGSLLLAGLVMIPILIVASVAAFVAFTPSQPG